MQPQQEPAGSGELGLPAEPQTTPVEPPARQAARTAHASGDDPSPLSDVAAEVIAGVTEGGVGLLGELGGVVAERLGGIGSAAGDAARKVLPGVGETLGEAAEVAGPAAESALGLAAEAAGTVTQAAAEAAPHVIDGALHVAGEIASGLLERS